MRTTVQLLFSGCMLFPGGFMQAGDATELRLVVNVSNLAGFDGPTIVSAEQIVAVGDGDRRHGVLLGERHDLVDLVRAFGERIRGADLEMDEIGDGHGPLWPPHLVESEAGFRV